MSYEIINGDSLKELKGFADNSVDSIVTDPPYGISFMGKKWDYDVPQVELWKEVLRVLKPGGHALVACGTRTQHRMAVNLEDAGFEIRDVVSYIYGSGFPKSTNIFKQVQKQCSCGIMGEYERTKEIPECMLRFMSEKDVSQTLANQKTSGEVLQSELSEQGTSIEGGLPKQVSLSERREESSLEGGIDKETTEGELQGSDLSEMPKGISSDGEKGRLYNATQTSDGSTLEQTTDENRSSASHRPQSEQQQDREPCAFCKQHFTQALGVYGFGSALKPSCEFWTLCRKPLSEKNLAQNVLKYGTGGINIDGCRVGTTDKLSIHKGNLFAGNSGIDTKNSFETDGQSIGRFPANLIHDGSDEVVVLFPYTKTGAVKNTIDNGANQPINLGGGLTIERPADSGSASRFFYCAKASKSERNKGLEGFEEVALVGQGLAGEHKNPTHQNSHPTVKPISLMRYLCKLITPQGGTILDPFMGSGSTGIGAKLEGFKFIGIEKEKDYCDIAEARISAH